MSFCGCNCADTMANVNVNAPTEQAPAMAPPTRIDDQILPRSRWDTIRYDRDTIRYIYQLDEKWFDLTKDTLRDALQITPVNNNNPFSSPPTPDALINFVNNLGYLKVVRTLSAVVTNDIFSHGGHSLRSLTYVSRERLQGLRDQELRCYRFSGASSIEAILIMQRGCRNNSPNLSIPSSKTKRIWHFILRERRKPIPLQDSTLHLPYEEYILGYRKFSAKGTKREVFGMPIPNELITADIQGEQYYKEYLEKVAKHQRYLAAEEGIDPDPPAQPAKATKKSKPSTPKATPVTKPAAAQQRKPKPALAKSQEKKRKLVTETFDKPSPAKSSKLGAVEEGLKSVHDAHRGPLSLVVIREPDSGKFQPLPEVQKRENRNDTGSDEEGSSVLRVGAQNEGQAGPNPGVQTKGQVRSNPGDDTEPQPQSSPDVHAGPNLEHMDLEATDVILKKPSSSTGTLSSLQNLAKDFSFGNLFLNDKPSEAENEKTTAETKAESMVSVTIQQDTFAILPMTTPVIDLTSRPDSPNVHRPLEATATKTKMTTTTTHPPPPQPQQSTTDSILIKRIGELEQIMENLIQDNKHLEERLDSHKSRLYTLENLDIPQQVSKAVDEIVTDAVDWAIQAPLQNRFRDFPKADMKEILHQRIKKKKRHDSPKTPHGSPPQQPPPPPPPAGPSRTSGSLGASRSSQLPLPPLPPSTSQIHSSDDEDIENAHIPKVNLQQDWWKPLEEDRPVTPEPAWSIPSSDLPVPMNNWASALASTYTPLPKNSLLAQTGDMAMFMDWFCKRQGITKLKPQDLEGLAFKLVKVFHPNVIHLQYQMEECHKLITDSVDELIIRYNVSKPLTLGGPPGHVTIQSDFLFNKDLEFLRYDSKGGRPALSISKMKAAYYPDVGLEQMVPDQMWIEEECKHISKGDRRAARTHMRILSVVKIEVFSMYGYDYMKNIVLRRADLNEHIIAKRDFKYLYPSDFEDLQRVEDFQLGIESYQTQLNLTKPLWDATGFEYKHDFTVIDSPRSVRFRDRYGVQMIMRLLFQFSWSFTLFYRLSHSELVDIEKVTVCSSLRSLKPKRTIESRAKRSSKKISLGHYSIMLASSHTVKSKTDIKSHMHYPRGIV
nr:hypothetical protein [Tanacetum cinerariifolium]